MKTIKLGKKDKISLNISIEKSGIKSWKGSFWKKLNLRHKNERVTLIIEGILWGFAILTFSNLETNEVGFYGDGELHQTSNTKGNFK